MLFRVSLPFHFEYERSFPFTSAVGENWSLYVRKLRDGFVILGVRAEITPPNVEERFVATSARFGNSVADALKTPERAIVGFLRYQRSQNRSSRRWAIGGIPLKTTAPEIPAGVRFPPISQIDKGFFAGLIDPIVSKSGEKVGVIKVFEEVTGEQQVLHQSAVFNIVVTSILWSITVALAAVYLRRTRVAEISCAQIPFLEESDTVEFKSSLRWDVVEKKSNPELEKAVIKAIAGFLNSENGGTLVIGLDDKKQVFGLEHDYSTLNTRPNRDGFEQALRQILINALGERCCARWIKVGFCSLQGKDLCKIAVSPATEPIFLKEKGTDDKIYVRVGNATRPLNAREAVAYAGDRWVAPTLRRSHLRSSAPHPAG